VAHLLIGASDMTALTRASAGTAVFEGGPSDDPEPAIGAAGVEVRVDKADRSRQAHEGVTNLRIACRVLACVFLVGMTVVWIVTFRPQALGGTASYVEVITSTMAPTVPEGDLVVAKERSSYQRGEIIVYRLPSAHSGAGKMIVSRIVGGNGVSGYITKGDSAPGLAPYHPLSADVAGKVWFHFPRTVLWPLIVAFAMVLVILVVVALPRRHHRPGAR
jgi:signal peptidase I